MPLAPSESPGGLSGFIVLAAILATLLVPLLTIMYVGVSAVREPCTMDSTVRIVLESPASAWSGSVGDCLAASVVVVPDLGFYRIEIFITATSSIDILRVEVTLHSTRGLDAGHFDHTRFYRVLRDLEPGDSVPVTFAGALPSDFPLIVVVRARAG